MSDAIFVENVFASCTRYVHACGAQSIVMLLFCICSAKKDALSALAVNLVRYNADISCNNRVPRVCGRHPGSIFTWLTFGCLSHALTYCSSKQVCIFFCVTKYLAQFW